MNTPPIEIRLHTHITAEERQHLFGWGTDIYGDNHYHLEWRPRQWHAFVYAADNLVGHVGFIKHEVQVGNQPVLVGGVGQVVTLPAGQRRGYARAALRWSAAFLCDELRAAFGLLFCVERMVPFYAGLGWQVVEAPVWIEQPTGRVISPMPVMVLPCQGQVWPAGAVELNSLPW
jgi:GNAT superfamily N-acetyltransferase